MEKTADEVDKSSVNDIRTPSVDDGSITVEIVVVAVDDISKVSSDIDIDVAVTTEVIDKSSVDDISKVSSDTESLSMDDGSITVDVEKTADAAVDKSSVNDIRSPSVDDGSITVEIVVVAVDDISKVSSNVDSLPIAANVVDSSSIDGSSNVSSDMDSLSAYDGSTTISDILMSVEDTVYATSALTS